MSDPDVQELAPRWVDPAWRASVDGWIEERLAERGLGVVGDVEQPHIYPWSTVLRVPTADGPVWFKANSPGTAYEVPLLERLAQWSPERVVAPLASDPGRGWMLLPDGGRTLRQADAGTAHLDHWERVLVEYADLQRLLAPRVADQLDAGVPDLRPEALPSHLSDLLADEDALLVDKPDGMASEQLRRLRSLEPELARWCTELAASGVPPSLQHDDLHDGNVFLPAEEGGPYRVFDWGDASVAHPFATLLVTLRVVAYRFDLPNGAAELLRLRDAYLEAWTAEHDRADLLQACALAVRTAPVGRALSWRRSLIGATEAARTRHGEGIPGWLGELGGPTSLEPAT